MLNNKEANSGSSKLKIYDRESAAKSYASEISEA